jgi:hypothetical protein
MRQLPQPLRLWFETFQYLIPSSTSRPPNRGGVYLFGLSLPNADLPCGLLIGPALSWIMPTMKLRVEQGRHGKPGDPRIVQRTSEALEICGWLRSPQGLQPAQAACLQDPARAQTSHGCHDSVGP